MANEVMKGINARAIAECIAQRLHERYGVEAWQIARIPTVSGRLAARRLIAAALGPAETHQYSVQYEINRKGYEFRTTPELAETLITRIGHSPLSIVFHDMPVPHGVEAAYCCRVENGPAVRVVYTYDIVKAAYILRADVLVSVIAAQEAVA